MPKLFIVDQFLRDYQGHNFGYSMSIAEAAEAVGLSPVIVANKALRARPEGRSWPVISWFDHPGHGGQPVRRRRLANLAPPAALADHLLLLAIRKHPAFRHLWGIHHGQGAPWARWIGRMAWPASLRALGRTLAECRASFGVQTADVARSFARQVAELIERKRAIPADHVLLHTVTFAELAALRDELVLIAPGRLPRLHIILRNDPGLDPPAYDLGACLDSFRTTGLWPTFVTFYSDTPELVSLYDACSPVRFREIPIPLWHAVPLAAEAQEPRTEERPVRIAYLGDARPEKGYQWLPSLVQDLWQDLVVSGRVTFTIQSNFNVPGGEPGIAEARNRLIQYPEHAVRILAEPLDDTTYRHILEEADLLVLPYDAERYRARSSGVMAEALALGKPLVAPAGTWLSAHAPADAIETFERPEGLSAAVRAALARRDAMADAAERASAAWRQRHSAPELVRTLLDCGAAEPSLTDVGPAILYVMDADAFLFRTGSSSVARNQLDYLRRCGYRIFGVFLSMDINNPGYDERRWRDELDRALPTGVFARHWLLSYRPRLRQFPSAVRMLEWIRRGEHSFARTLAMYDGMDIPEDLMRFARRTPVAGVFINYVAAQRLVERLGLADRPILCETHDLQAFQHAHYGRRPVDPAELDHEYRLLDRCAAVIMLSDLEAAKVAPHLRKARVFDVRPLIDAAPARPGDMAGYADLGALLTACGLEPGREAVTERLAHESHVDLLYVSTLHQPNLVSFRWFYDEVFRPHLAGRGVNLLVAGNIERVLTDLNDPRVFLAGRVDDLRPLYAATRLVVLPMRMGAGFNIKTMEALAYGKPVVATRFAMRSLAGDLGRLPIADEPDGFADRILELLDSPKLRADAAAEALRVAAANNRPDLYDAAMNAACQAAWGSGVPLADPRKAEPTLPALLCEWTAAVNRFNRHLCGIGGGAVDTAEIREDLARSANWAAAADIHRMVVGGDFAVYARDAFGITAPQEPEPEPELSAARQLWSIRHFGHVEGVDRVVLGGWLIDRAAKGRPAEVVVYDEAGRPVAEGIAALPRPDLKRLEFGTGGHGFRIRLPSRLFDGRPHVLSVRPKGENAELYGSPVTVQLSRADAVIGFCDGVADGHLCGWARDEIHPDEPLWIQVTADGAPVARVQANIFRQDLLDAGIGRGRHGFRAPLPPSLFDGQPLRLAAVPEVAGRPLPTSS